MAQSVTKHRGKRLIHWNNFFLWRLTCEDLSGLVFWSNCFVYTFLPPLRTLVVIVTKDGKDLSLTNLTPSSFGLRHMDSYGGLPAQLVHLQNPFLHPALEARLPFGSTGAFRPVVTSSTSSTPTSSSSADERINAVKGLSSAFTAANLVNNRRKLDSIVESVIEQQHHQSGRSRGSGAGAPSQSQQNEQNAYSQGSSASGVGVINLDKSASSGASFMNGGQSRHRSSSPASSNVHVPTSSPSVKQEERDRDRADECTGDERDGNGTPNSDVTERSTPEDAHPSKSKRNFFPSLFLSLLSVVGAKEHLHCVGIKIDGRMWTDGIIIFYTHSAPFDLSSFFVYQIAIDWHIISFVCLGFTRRYPHSPWLVETTHLTYSSFYR